MRSRFYCLFLLSLVPALAQPTIPDTPAGHVFSAWLDAFNSGDETRIAAFYSRYQPSQSVEGMVNFRANTGGFDLIAIDKSEPEHLQVRVKEHNRGLIAIGKLDVKPGNPPQIERFSILAIPPGASLADFQITPETRARVIDGAIAMLNEFYVFPETAAKMATALRAQEQRGDYNSIMDGDDFADRLTADLQAVSHDKHLRVSFNPSRLPKEEPHADANAAAENRKRLERINCGFQKVELLPGNIGYLKFNMFADADICGPTATAAMQLLGNADAIIFDLRDNGGGQPEMIALISTYLFGEPTHLNDLWERKGDKTRQFWTLPYVPGKRLEGKPAYVLTSKRTFSGAEEFSYNLKNLKRATIVGETTGGGAHPVSGHRIDDHFLIGVPFARAINPISKTNWEGTGVEPDLKVPAADALATAQKLATEKLHTKQ
jgi:hypothetical protein